LRALLGTARIKVRVDKFGVEAADRHCRLWCRIIGVPDVEAEVDEFPAVQAALCQEAVGFVFPSRDEVVPYPGVEKRIHALCGRRLSNIKAEPGIDHIQIVVGKVGHERSFYGVRAWWQTLKLNCPG